MTLTPYQTKYFAYELTRRFPSGSSERLNMALVESTLHAFKLSLSKEARIADVIVAEITIFIV